MTTITTIDQNWLAKTNPKKDWSMPQHIMDYTVKNGGYGTVMQIAHDAIKLGNEINKDAGVEPSKLFTRLQTDLNSTIDVLPLLRLPASSLAAMKSFNDLKEENGVSYERKTIDAIRDASNCISTYAFSAAIFTSHPSIKAAAQITELTASALGIPTAASDYCKAAMYEELATGEVKTAFEHSKNYYLLNLARNMTYTLSGALALILYASGAPLVSVIALTVISLAAATFEMMRDIQKESGAHPVIDMNREIQVV